MKRNYRQAYNELKKIGAPVFEGGDSGGDTFRISAENNSEKNIWADYHAIPCFENGALDDFGVNHKINVILEKNGLFAEWINPAVLAVCEG